MVRRRGLHRIGEDVAERLDVVPTTFRVLATLAELRRSERLFADETTAPLLNPDRGQTKTGRL